MNVSCFVRGVASASTASSALPLVAVTVTSPPGSVFSRTRYAPLSPSRSVSVGGSMRTPAACVPRTVAATVVVAAPS